MQVTTLSVHFPDFGEETEPFAGCIVHRAQLNASLGALFEVTLTVHSTDAGVDPHVVIGARAELRLEGEPHLDRIPDLVRAVRQLSSVVSPTGGTASYYEVVLAPSLFMARHRAGRRIYQDKDILGLLRSTFDAYQSAIAAPIASFSRPHGPREYTTQYDETDHDFVFRILSEEGLVSYFDPARGSALVVVDDVGSLTPSLPFHLTYRPGSALDQAGPSALSIRFEDGYASGATMLRDYDFRHPQMSRGVPVTLVGNAQTSEKAFPRGSMLTHEGYEVDRFASEGSGQAIARRDLVALRAGARILEVETNLAIFPGTRFFIDDHPRGDSAEELVVISSRIILDDGIPMALGGSALQVGAPRRIYSLRCVRVSHGFVPARKRKPRAIGPETAFVVGALGDGQVDVDEYGRVLIEFVWDRRDQRTGAPSRRVRVAQGWAGANRGFVTLPRIGDEVLIGFDGGDPDQPIVLGRVHVPVHRVGSSDGPKRPVECA